MTSSVLHQTLRNLCHDVWCYAVFWRLKRQSRMVLTWEDAFYEQSKTREIPELQSNSSTMDASISLGEISDVNDPIGLAVAKMSYHIYSVGEGIIGKVAFTNKHQWIFSSTNKVAVTTGIVNSKRNMRSQPDKYPAGWDHQFAVGINTIAVIAVPQGVVQLGSTQTVSEDMKLVEHVKALFGTLQNIPGAYLSDIVAEVQNGGIHTLYSMPPQMHHVNTSRVGLTSNGLIRSPSMAVSIGSTGGGAFGSTVLFNPHSQEQPSPVIIGMQGSSAQRLDPMPHKFSGGLERQTSTTVGSQTPIPIGKNPNVELFQQLPIPISRNTNVDLCLQASTPAGNNLNVWAHRVGMGAMKAAAAPPRMGIISKISLSSGQSTTPEHTVETKNMSYFPLVALPKYSSMGVPNARVSEKVEVPTPLGVSSCIPLNKNSPILESKAGSPSLQTSTPVPSSVKPPLSSRYSVNEHQVADRGKSLEDSKGVSPIGHTQYVIGRPLVKVPQSVRDSSLKKVQKPICYRPPVDIVESDKPVADFINSRHATNNLDGKTLGQCQSNRPLEYQQHLLDVTEPVVGNQLARLSSESLHLNHTDDTSFSMERPHLSESITSSENTQLFCTLPSSEGMQIIDKHNQRLTPDRGYQSFEDRRHPPGAHTSAERYQNVPLIGKPQSSAARQTTEGARLSEASRRFDCAESSKKRSQLAALRCPVENSLPVDTEISTLYKSGLVVNSKCTNYTTVELGAFNLSCEGLRPLAASNNSICSDGQTSHMSQLPEIPEHHGLNDSSTVTTGLDGTLFCDSFMEDWNSPNMPFHDVDFSVNQELSGANNGTHNTFKSELEDFDDFLASLTNESENKSEFTSELEAGATFIFPNKETVSCKVACNIQEKVHADWSTKVQTTREDFNQCHEAVISTQPLSNKGESRKWRKKGAFPGEDGMDQQKKRQKVQKYLSELRNIIPSGGSYDVDTLLEKTVKYANFLQTALHESDNQTQSNKRQKGEGSIGALQHGVEGKEINASWVIELHQKGNCCPIIVEDLSRPQQMLVEVVCEQKGMIKKIEKTFKKLHLVVLRGIMEARDDKIWARFVVEAPQDVHRVQVLWSLMQLLEPR